MALHGKIVTTLELKSSAEKFYKVWRSESFHVPKHASKHIQGVDVHAGDWETAGSIRIWQYTVGKAMVKLARFILILLLRLKGC